MSKTGYPVIRSFGPITDVFLAVSLPTVKTATDHRHRRLGTLLALKVALHYNTGNALAISIRGQKYGAGNKSAGLAEEKVSDRFISYSQAITRRTTTTTTTTTSLLFSFLAFSQKKTLENFSRL